MLQLHSHLLLGGIRQTPPPHTHTHTHTHSSDSLNHVSLHLVVYLLGFLPPLPQPVEAVAGVQPVVGVVVLTHPPLPQTHTLIPPLFTPLLLLLYIHSSLSLSLRLLSETKRADLSPLWSSHSLWLP